MNRFVMAAAALVLATNAAVLAGVAYNRSGEPVATLELTERELRLQPVYPESARNENTGVSLTLEWQTLSSADETQRSYSRRSQPAWLDEAKLEELGFDLDSIKPKTDDNDYRRKKLKMNVILVMEYNGPTYLKALARAKQWKAKLQGDLAANPDDDALAERLKDFRKDIERLTTSDSRLFVVDAGTDMRSLRQRYAGNSKILLLKGTIEVFVSNIDITAYIDNQPYRRVHVPLPEAELLSPLDNRDDYFYYDDTTLANASPRYRTTLNVGQRLEPWVESVSLIEKSQ